MQHFQRRTGQLKLSARFQRYIGETIRTGEADNVVAFIDRLPAKAGHAFQHGADAVRPVIGNGRAV